EALAPTTDFTKLEEGENKPGGGATSRGSTDTANAFSLSSGNMDFRRELDFKVGKRHLPQELGVVALLNRLLSRTTPSLQCARLPQLPFEGHPPFSSDVPDDSGSMLVRLWVPAATERRKADSLNSIPDPTYGGQLQNFSIQGFKPEGQLKIEYTEKKCETRR